MEVHSKPDQTNLSLSWVINFDHNCFFPFYLSIRMNSQNSDWSTISKFIEIKILREFLFPKQHSYLNYIIFMTLKVLQHFNFNFNMWNTLLILCVSQHFNFNIWNTCKTIKMSLNYCVPSSIIQRKKEITISTLKIIYHLQQKNPKFTSHERAT